MSVLVTLRFETEEAKRFFMGGLSDGFGESACEIEWPHREGVKFDDADTFDIVPLNHEYEPVGSPAYVASVAEELPTDVSR